MTPGEHFWRRAFRATGPLLLWAAHFFACYVAIAVGCHDAADGAPPIDATLRSGLVIATLVAIAIEALWLAAERRRASQPAHDGIAGPLAAGSAALAIVALLWLLAAVLWTPMCRPL